jgi:ubiquinol-cytochrome c reductase cytochrome b subunit
MPEMGGYFLEHANFEQANALKTPEHIAPVWYYTPYYSMLRAVTYPLMGLDAKFWGFVVMAGAIAIMFVLPWLDRSAVKSVRYKGGFTKFMILHFAVTFIVLGILGVKAATPDRTLLAQVGTVFYFAFFIGMPVWTNRDVLGGFPRWCFALFFGGFFAYLALDGISEGDSMSAPIIRLYALLHAALFLLMPRFIAGDATKTPPDRITMDGGMGAGKFACVLLAMAVLVLIPVKAAGAGGGKSCGAIDCYDFTPALEDKAALQRGASTFVNYCLGCHEAAYSRYERVGMDLGFPEETREQLLLDNLIFDDSKVGSLMTNAMPEDLAKKWFGATPPDLTLASRARGADWLYTYLLTFHQDESRPWGVNNLVFKDVGMPNVLAEVQGTQTCLPAFKIAENGGIAQDPISGEFLEDDHQPCGRVSHVEDSGAQTPEEFEKTISDLVSYMAYMAEPVAVDRARIGIYVMFFLGILLVFTWLLNREYWKDVH